MSGSGGDRGYDYQADGYAYVAAHGLAGLPLNWFDDKTDVPAAILMETGGAGDDQQIITTGGRRIELQAKHAFKRGEDLFETLRKMVRILNNAPDLRGVFMVDRHTSETITEDLRQDLIRLGQGRRDDLKPITRAVLEDLHAQGIPADKAFERLRVVVVDLDEGSDGMAAACAMLGTIVEPVTALTAYKLLGKRGHWLMKNRGRDPLHNAAEQLEKELGLRQDTKSPFAELVRFRRWVETSNREFYSPALRKRFPISQAWNSVRPLNASDQTDGAQGSTREMLAREILRYQEWHRLAETFSDHRASDSETFVRLHKQTVLVGGPGAGKSTLARRLSYELSTMGKLVVRVRLKSVATMISRGQPFDEALQTAAIDGSGMAAGSVTALMVTPEVLIADGLDECDPIRADLATGLKTWSDGRPSTLICVLTRPVGHVPDLLPGFAHAELLPLDPGSIRLRVEWFTAALIADPGKAAASAANFMENVVDKSQASVASIASRNPLLLTFLIRLHVDGIPIATKRAALFESIIDLMIKSNPIDRPHGSTLDRATAWRAAEALGWECLERPESSVAELTARIAKSLGGDYDAERHAEKAIFFWEEHGLIERLTLGSLDAITFVHPALGEYLAGRCLAKLELLSEHISRMRRHSKYRETILLAGGCGAIEEVTIALLDHDDPMDPASTEAVLAASGLTEVQLADVRAETVQKVIMRLQQRLRSPIPLIAIEAGEGLVAISALAPEIIGPCTAALWDHPQPWTQLASRAACLAAGAKFIDISDVVRTLLDFEPQTGVRIRAGTKMMPDNAYDLQAKMLSLAVERLIRELKPAEAEPILRQLLEKRKLSVTMIKKLAPLLTAAPYTALLEQATRSMTGSSSDIKEGMARLSDRHNQANRFFFQCVLKALGVERRSGTVSVERCHVVAAVFAAIRYWDTALPDWHAINSDLSVDVVVEVIRGTVAAIEVSKEELGYEANSMLDLLEQHRSILDVPNVELKVDWTKAGKELLNSVLLTTALHSRCSPIAVTAAELLAAGAGHEHAKQLVLDVLQTGEDRALLLAGAVLNEIFGPDAFELLNERLRGPLTGGCGYLYSHLIRAAAPEQLETAIDRAVEGLKSANGRIAFGAAEMLKGLEPTRLSPRIDQLREAMQRWTDLGSWCDTCNIGVLDGSCPKCHIVAPTPRTALIPILAELGAVSIDQLVMLTIEPWHGVPEAARIALTKLAAADRSIMKIVLEKVSKGEADLQVVESILALPAQALRGVSDLLLTLLECSHPDVRTRIVLALSGPWIDRVHASQLARKALNDSSPAVRNSATVSLRALIP